MFLLYDLQPHELTTSTLSVAKVIRYCSTGNQNVPTVAAQTEFYSTSLTTINQDLVDEILVQGNLTEMVYWNGKSICSIVVIVEKIRCRELDELGKRVC